MKENYDIFSKNSFHALRKFAEQENLVYIDLVKNDWFFKRMLNYYKKNTYIRSAVFVTVLVIAAILSGVIEGVFVNKDLKIDMLQDIGFWVIIVVNYVLIFLSILVYRNISKLFISFYQCNVINADKEVFNNFFSMMDKKINKKVIILLMWTAGTVIFVFQYRLMPLNTISSWHIPNEIGKISVTSLLFIPLNLLHQILIVQFLVRTVLISFIMVQFFLSNKLHLDFSNHKNTKLCGIVIIGKLTLINTSLTFILSLFLAFALYSNTQIYGFSMSHFYNIILLIEFFICSFVSIFSPILLLI